MEDSRPEVALPVVLELCPDSPEDVDARAGLASLSREVPGGHPPMQIIGVGPRWSVD
jgi:hypothetical protein